MIAPLPTDPAQLRALATAHENAARILRTLAHDLSPAPIATTHCLTAYEFRGDAVPDIPPAPLTIEERAERDLQRFREARDRAERESRKC
jgi:hypothetical protein